MRFFLKSIAVLVLLLGVADYRYWQQSIEYHEISTSRLEETIFQQMAERVRLPLQIEHLRIIPGSLPDELGLRLAVNLMFDDQSQFVEMDLKAYQWRGVLQFTRPCLRPVDITDERSVPGKLYKSVVKKELGYSSYRISVADIPAGSGSPIGRPVTDIDYGEDSVILQVGMPATLQQGQELLTGKAFKPCKGD